MFKVVVGSCGPVIKAVYRSWLRRFVRLDIRSLMTCSDQSVLDAAYTMMSLPTGATKETRPRRFRGLDSTVVRLMRETNVHRVHDCGVSSGVTSLDLRESARAAGLDIVLYVSDKYAGYTLVASSRVTLAYDADGDLAFAYVYGIYGDRTTSWFFPVSKLAYFVARFTRPPAGCPVETVMLFDPNLLRLIERGEIHAIDYDVFSSRSPVLFDYVRCMNILLPANFPYPRLAEATVNLGRSLQEGGILQLGRTRPDGGNHVSFYMRRGARLVEIDQVGEGNEFGSIVETCVLPAEEPQGVQAVL